MQLIVNLKLKTLDSQKDALLKTMKEANRACNAISEIAFENKVFKQFNLHKLCYAAIRKQFNLSAQAVVRQIAKVCDAYKLDQKKKREFFALGSIAYDDRIISFKKNDGVSIWTVEGRLSIPFETGEHQRNLLQYRKGEVKLVFRKGVFYLNAVCDVSEESPITPKDVLGCDCGIVEILTDSDGVSFSGKQIEKVRRIFTHRRRNLQRKQTKSAKRKLKQLSGKQKNFQKTINHQISKQIVSKAKDTCRSIAVEELTGISKRVTVRRSQRNRLNNWSFYDLRQKLEYKAKLNGVTVIAVNPRNTSRQCSQCGFVSKHNRKTQSQFVCQECNFSANADYNASLVIRERALSTSQTDLQKSKAVRPLNRKPLPIASIGGGS